MNAKQAHKQNRILFFFSFNSFIIFKKILLSSLLFSPLATLFTIKPSFLPDFNQLERG